MKRDWIIVASEFCGFPNYYCEDSRGAYGGSMERMSYDKAKGYKTRLEALRRADGLSLLFPHLLNWSVERRIRP